ncbi:winged helix-turn-helix domain-containing protein [Kordiimonas aquimaris]|uniref:winged helix-turn-helix domain-containing protein n=1 Tax=Kordiimonas aquimaris TaxID=707591 RepID=UPI0021D100B6|nr:winged helix-turn-helix domain-containing protein [Kordiimonas aquimaris]
MINTAFYLDDLLVEPQKNLVHLPSGPTYIQPRLMDVLVILCSRRGRVLSAEKLLELCWSNKALGDNPVHKCVAELRRFLGDQAKAPKYIKTIPRKGYMIIAEVSEIGLSGSVAVDFWLDRTPYPGKRSYDTTEAAIFFGRTQVIEEISKHLYLLSGKTTPWIHIVGAPRCGVSSLLKAGIIPYLNKTESCAGKLSGIYLFDFLEHAEIAPHQALLYWLFQEGLMSRDKTRSHYEQLLVSSLEGDTGAADLLNVAFRKNQHKAPTDKLSTLIIDHLNIPLDCGSTKYIALLGLLLSKLSESGYFRLITAAKPASKKILHQCSVNFARAFRYTVPEFNQSEIEDVLRFPAIAAGLEFDFDETAREPLDAIIVHDISKQQVPVGAIQEMLFYLYHGRSQNRITFRQYRQMGGVAGFLAKQADEVLAEVSEKERRSLSYLIVSFIKLNAAGDDLVCADPMLLNTLGSDSEKQLIAKLIDSNILKATIVDGWIGVQLAHRGLIEKWSICSTWLGTNIETMYARHDLKTAADRWKSHDKQERYLGISRETANKARQISHHPSYAFLPHELTFIEKSAAQMSRRKRIRHTAIGVISSAAIGLAALSYSLIQKNTQLQQTKQNAESLISAVLHDLKQKLEPIDKLELIEIVGARAQDYFEAAGTDQLTEESLTQWAEALNIMGQVRTEKLEYDRALPFFENSAALLNGAHQGFLNKASLLEQAMITHYWLGYIPFKQGDYAAVKQHWETYLDIASQLIELENSNINWHIEKSYALTNLGSLAEKTGNLRAAEQYLGLSADMKQQILQRRPNDTTIRSGLANTLSWQATTLMKTGQLKQARIIYETALAEAKTLQSSVPDDYKRVRQRALLEHRLALSLYDLGELTYADQYTKATQIHLRQLMTNDPMNNRYKQRMFWSMLLRTKVLRHLNMIDEGLNQISEASALYATISLDTAEDFIPLIQQEQARLFAAMNQNSAAIVMIDRAIDAQSMIAQDTAQAITLNAELLVTKAQLISFCCDGSKPDFAADLREAGVKLTQATKDPRPPKVQALLLALSQLLASPEIDQGISAKLMATSYRNPDLSTFLPIGTTDTPYLQADAKGDSHER